MHYHEIREILRHHFTLLLQEKREEVATSGPLSDRAIQALENGRDLAIQSIMDGESDDLFDTGPSADALIEKYGLGVRDQSVEYHCLNSELKVAYRDFCQALLTDHSALGGYDFTSPPTNVPKPKSVVKPHTIATLAGVYATEKQTTESWAPKTKLEKDDHIKLLSELLGEQTDVADIGAEEMNRVKAALQRYPRNRSKNPATRGKPLDELLEMGGLETIQVPTINKYLQTYNDLFAWATTNGLVERNWFSKVTLRQKKGEQKRAAFSAVQVQRIEAAITGPKDGLVKKDYQRWGPLIGIYSGARLNEIAQLHLSDIRKVDGLWCFDVNDVDGKQLKTFAAQRLVPIHEKLIGHGLLGYVEAMKEKGNIKLFPDFPFSVNNGYGRNLGRWFNEKLLPALDIKTTDLVFHSLRHTVITQLMQNDVSEPLVKALVGHSREGVTQQNYFKGYKVAQLNEALQKLDFSVVDSLQLVDEGMQIQINKFSNDDQFG